MADWVATSVPEAPVRIAARHSWLVRLTHWLTVISFLTLLVTGIEILISHPRFYWGETGNIGMKPLFAIPIPASRQTVPTGYQYVLPDQNGWSRYLHFEAAWLLVITGAGYLLYGLAARHFSANLMPERGQVSWRELRSDMVKSLRFKRPPRAEEWSYNLLQRLTYIFVIFALFPLVIWTGLAMSPTFVSAAPITVTSLGGQQSARTIHFFVTIILVLFLLVHLAMLFRVGFWKRVRAMITGYASSIEEHL